MFLFFISILVWTQIKLILYRTVKQLLRKPGLQNWAPAFTSQWSIPTCPEITTAHATALTLCCTMSPERWDFCSLSFSPSDILFDSSTPQNRTIVCSLNELSEVGGAADCSSKSKDLWSDRKQTIRNTVTRRNSTVNCLTHNATQIIQPQDQKLPTKMKQKMETPPR